MEVLEAYCEELGRVVEIYEAQEEYFAQPAGNRHRLQFRCSDAACRAEKNPLVVGVNYDKIAEESDKYQQPHFKSHTKHPHIDACIWMAGDAGRHEANPSEDERDARHPRPKATNVVDVFEPRNSDTLLGSTVADVRPPAVASGDTVQEDGGLAGGRTGTTTTSRLEKLIDCWSQMEPDERRSHRITVGGQTLNYQQLCLRVTQLRESENGSRVVYGGARVKAWPAAEPTHYFVDFMDGCDRFADAAGEKSVTISLFIKRLEKTRRGALLIHRIEQALRPKHYLQVYAWGEIVERGRGKGYELKLAALDNLVLKAIESKKTRLQSNCASSASTHSNQRESALHAPIPPTNRPAQMPVDPVTLPPLRPASRAGFPFEPVALAPPARPVSPTPTHALPAQPRPVGMPVRPTQLPTAVPEASTPVASRPATTARELPPEPQGLIQRLSAWWRERLRRP